MKKLNSIYYCQNYDINEYMDILLETDQEWLKLNITSFDKVLPEKMKSMEKLDEFELMKEKYGALYINDIRRTYDNDIYILLSEKLFLIIEYALSSNSNLSVQQFRFVEDIQNVNKKVLDFFKELHPVKI